MLKRPSEKYLVNTANTKEIVMIDAAGAEIPLLANYCNTVKVSMPRLGIEFLVANMIVSTRECKAAGTAGVVEVAVVVDAAPCASCPFEWALRVTFGKTSYRILDITDGRYKDTYLNYVSESSTVPLASTIATNVVASVTADKACIANGVTAAVKAGGGNEHIIVLTGTDLQPFSAYVAVGLGSATVTTAFNAATLQDDDMKRLFPIGHADYGSAKQFPQDGESYCKYTLQLGLGQTRDLAHSMGHVNVEGNFNFYIKDNTGNRTAVDEKLAAISAYTALV
jgi:hypothetical protein